MLNRILLNETDLNHFFQCRTLVIKKRNLDKSIDIFRSFDWNSQWIQIQWDSDKSMIQIAIKMRTFEEKNIKHLIQEQKFVQDFGPSENLNKTERTNLSETWHQRHSEAKNKAQQMLV